MSSWQARFMSFAIRNTFKRKLAASADALQARAVMNSGRVITPRGLKITPATVGGVPGEWVALPELADQETAPVLLFLHGGGYFACSPQSHRPYTAFFARKGFRVFAPDYRLAPEHPFPAAVDDAQAVYAALLAMNIDPQRLTVAGDSAGGGLSLSLLLRAKQHGWPMPAAAALFSPLTDLASTGASILANSKRCAMFIGERMETAAGFYLAGRDMRDPIASPLYADLKGLPPLLIHVGRDEVLRDDSTRLATRARNAGVPVELRIWDAVPHDWQLFQSFIPEARESLADAAAFLKKWLLARNALRSAPDTKPDSSDKQSGEAGQAGRPDVEVAVIGSGFSGLGMAIQLKKSGQTNFIVLEKSDRIGGTWRENTYPGCACDVPSHLYSFSFERNPEWSRMYSTQPEIQRYLEHCVEKYGIGPYIRYGAELRDAVFDEKNNWWTVRTADGCMLTARVVVSAMGALHRPAYPDVPGLKRFQGASFHSAEWQHDLDLTGKRIAVIGTGASAVQFVPQIAPKAAQLTLFQRTPPWILAKLDRPIRAWEKWAFHRIPGAIGLFRDFVYWRQEMTGLAFFHPKLMKSGEKLARRFLAHHIKDPALRAKLTPSYTMGCKRVLISNDYFPALARPNVEVVTDGIAEVRENSIVGRDGVERPVDVIIFGTGFRVTDLLAPVRIIGRDGVDLDDAWREGPEAHLGLAAAGFPNLFLLLGPNTGLGHNSVIFMAEQQIRYVLRCLRLMKQTGATAIEVRQQAQARFNRHLQDKLHTTVWASGCKSWYLNDKGRNVTLWPGFTFQYWSRMKKLDAGDFDLVKG